jgi:hypothetical protein
MRAVFTPILAEAAAASQPACPPPITTTSKFSMKEMYNYKINLQDMKRGISPPDQYTKN